MSRLVSLEYDPNRYDPCRVLDPLWPYWVRYGFTSDPLDHRKVKED